VISNPGPALSASDDQRKHVSDESLRDGDLMAQFIDDTPASATDLAASEHQWPLDCVDQSSNDPSAQFPADVEWVIRR
jgi:hypothetical protein